MDDSCTYPIYPENLSGTEQEVNVYGGISSECCYENIGCLIILAQWNT